MKTNYLTADDVHDACKELYSGRHGSFAKAIAWACIVADSGNRTTLVEAFPDLFERGYHFAQSRRLQQA